MLRNASAGLARLGVFVLASGGILCAALWLGPVARADDAPAAGGNKKIAELIALGHKFQGTSSCKSCHGGAAGEPGKAAVKNSELTVWSTVDKHHEAFTELSSDRSKAIATKYGYADAVHGEKCLSCHALTVPDSVKTADFKVEEGVSCEACHGPSADWSNASGDPHKTTGWYQKRTSADGYDPRAAAKADGLWDVKVPSLRAENCASCHLSIDAKMVAAGHPQPAFELNEYASLEPAHWNDKHGDQYFTQLWAAGQAVCARDAMLQLAERAGGGAAPADVKSAYDQAMAHASMLQILANADNGVGTEVKDDLNKAMKDLADSKGADASKVKDPATAVAGLADKVVQADLKDFAPDAGATDAILQKVIGQADDLGKNYGRRGAEQAAYAAKWLYLSKTWDAKPKAEFPAELEEQYKAFYENRAKDLGDDAAKFTDVISKIKANP